MATQAINPQFPVLLFSLIVFSPTQTGVFPNLCGPYSPFARSCRQAVSLRWTLAKAPCSFMFVAALNLATALSSVLSVPRYLLLFDLSPPLKNALALLCAFWACCSVAISPSSKVNGTDLVRGFWPSSRERVTQL